METSSRPPAGSSQVHLDSNYLAGTRTLLSLVRTGAGIAGGGAVVTELLVRGWPQWVAGALSSAFVFSGYWLIWAATREGRRLRLRFERAYPDLEFVFPDRVVTAVTVAFQVLLAAVVTLYLLRH